MLIADAETLAETPKFPSRSTCVSVVGSLTSALFYAFQPRCKTCFFFGHVTPQEPAKPIGFLCIVFPANDNGNQQKPSWDGLFIPMAFV